MKKLSLMILIVFPSFLYSNSILKKALDLSKPIRYFKQYLYDKLVENVSYRASQPLFKTLKLNEAFFSSNINYSYKENKKIIFQDEINKKKFEFQIERIERNENSSSKAVYHLFENKNLYPKPVVLKLQSFRFANPQENEKKSILRNSINLLKELEEFNMFDLKDQNDLYTRKLNVYNLARIIQGSLLGARLGGPKLYDVVVHKEEYSDIVNYGFVLEKLNTHAYTRSLKDLIRDDFSDCIFIADLPDIDQREIMVNIIEIVNKAVQEKIIMQDPDFFIDFKTREVRVIDTDLYFQYTAPTYKEYFDFHNIIVHRQIHDMIKNNHFNYLVYRKKIMDKRILDEESEAMTYQSFSRFYRNF